MDVIDLCLSGGGAVGLNGVCMFLGGVESEAKRFEVVLESVVWEN